MMFEASVNDTAIRESAGIPPINLEAETATVNPSAKENAIGAFFTNYSSNGKYYSLGIKGFSHSHFSGGDLVKPLMPTSLLCMSSAQVH